MGTITVTKKLGIKKEYDVIICGGGVAGAAAAVTAAESGHSTLLLEKSCILGGLATLGLINLFVPMCNGRGKQIIFGLCEKWARMSAEHGYDTIPEAWKNGEPKEKTDIRYIQRFSPHIFALQLTESLSKAGVDILFDTTCCDPVMEGKRCRGVITESKEGTSFYGAKVVIDTTGDCDVLRRGGVPTVSGQNFFTYVGKMITMASCEKAVKEKNIYHAFETVTGGDINLFGDNHPADVPKWSGLSAEEVTDYLIRNQLLLLEKLKKTDKNARELTHIPMMPQFRTTTHLLGDYALKVTDAYKHFDDSICAINDFEHRDYLFEVPLRAITRRDYPNVLTAGRSAAGDGYAWDLLRVIPPAILTGQAAAHAAVMAIEDKVGVGEVSVPRLQERLEKDNIMVHFPDSYVPSDKTVVIHGKKAAEICGGHF